MKNLYLLLVFSCYCATAQITKLQPGPYKPGFISLTHFDASRPAVKEQTVQDKGRIIQVNVWYPSTGNTKQTSFADYVYLIGKELDSSETNTNWKQNGIDKYFSWPQSAGADKKTFTDFLNDHKPMMAFVNGKPVIKKFPMVLLVHGFAADHAYIAEYIASYGYTVVNVPVKGTMTYELDYAEKGLETQVVDYEFALSVLPPEFVNAGDKAVVGYSFGGQSAVALALRNNSIKCIISFDGGIGSAFGTALLQQQPYYAAIKINQPILHLYNPADEYTNLEWFGNIKTCNRFLVPINNTEHGYFTSFGLLNKVVPNILGANAPQPGDAYEAIMVLTKAFIDASLRNKQTPGENFMTQQQETYTWIKACIGSASVIKAGT